MKQSRKIYDRAFKEKAVQLSYERHNISELARELGITAPQLYSGVKSTKSLDKEVFQVMAS
jgi:transposase